MEKAVLNKLKRAQKTVSQIRVRKQRLVDVLRGFRHLMTPGWYRIETRLAYRIGATRPPALVQTKGYRYKKQLPLVENLKLWVVERCVPPCMVYISSRSFPGGVRYDQLVLSREGDVKLFSTTGGVVLSLLSQNGKRERLIRAHSILGHYLPVSRLEVMDDSTSLREGFVVGQSLHFTQMDTQYRVYKSLLRQLVGLVRDMAVPRDDNHESHAVVENALKLTKGLPVNQFIRVRKKELIHVLSSAPCIPSHGDMVGQNVIVGPGGGGIHYNRFGRIQLLSIFL